MRKRYDSNIIVSIPEGAHICNDSRVYVVKERIYYPSLKYNMDKRLWIGKAISKMQMYPNDTYKLEYPEELKKIPHLNLPVYHKRVGLYAAALSIGRRTGLYDDLVEYLGPESANLVMDYAAYSIGTKSNVVKDFDCEMSDRMLFLSRAFSDSWINDRIQNTIADNHVEAFKNAWIKRFRKEEPEEVWVCIDGSNNDCTADIPEAEKGKAKSHKNINIVSYMYAVTQDGTPIASQVYRGNRVDAKAFVGMINFLKGHEIMPKGLVLDRGFCDDTCIRLLINKGYQFVIMMKENTNGYQQLLEKYRDSLKFSWKYALGHGLYGMGEKVTLFKKSSLQLHCVLTWDAKNGGIRTDYLVDGLMETISNAEENIAQGKVPTIPSKYSQYISLDTTGDTPVLAVKDELIQKDMLDKGYYGLICSSGFSAGEANRIYDLRDSSEKQYSILKTQLGGYSFRAHKMHGIVVREMIAFVASIIRNELLKACQSSRPRLDVNKTIKELDLVTMDLRPDGNYEITDNQSDRQKWILKSIGVTAKNLNYIASYENKRISGEAVSPIQILEDTVENQKSESETRHVDGIPKGSKAKGKGAKSAEESDKPKRKAGRPKGSKNKPKDPVEKPKREPGRPKGSKNKPKAQELQAKPKRGAGRPKGSKNKSKDANTLT